MQTYSKKAEVRWSDLDPNFHVVHSKYYDYGAYCRMAFFTEHGITPAFMIEQQIGPILFKETCLFKREIKFGDRVEVFLKLSKCSDDARRWSMEHEIWINDNVLAALISIDGAWLDTCKRKLIIPPAICKTALLQMPRSENFNQ